MKMKKTRKPKPLHFYTNTAWCEVRRDGKRRIMLKSPIAYAHPVGVELSVPAHKRLWKWLKRACDWVEGK